MWASNFWWKTRGQRQQVFHGWLWCVGMRVPLLRSILTTVSPQVFCFFLWVSLWDFGIIMQHIDLDRWVHMFGLCGKTCVFWRTFWPASNMLGMGWSGMDVSRFEQIGKRLGMRTLPSPANTGHKNLYKKPLDPKTMKNEGFKPAM